MYLRTEWTAARLTPIGRTNSKLMRAEINDDDDDDYDDYDYMYYCYCYYYYYYH